MSSNVQKYKNNILSLIIIVISYILASSPVFSDSEALPSDFSQVTKNSDFIFVMLSPFEKRTLEYNQSGLYKNNGTQLPEWTVDWYSFGVIPHSNGKHLVRFGPWASSVLQEALSFYKNGKLIKQYNISDLIKDKSKLEHTVSHFSWREDVEYLEDEGVIYLKTKDNIEYIFSIYSGNFFESNDKKYNKILKLISIKRKREREEKKKKWIEESKKVSEAVPLDEATEIIANDIIQRLPNKFTIKESKKVFNSLIAGTEELKSQMWKNIHPIITSSNRILEINIDGKIKKIV